MLVSAHFPLQNAYFCLFLSNSYFIFYYKPMIKDFLRSVILNTIVLVVIAMWIPLGWLSISPLTRSATPILLVMGFFFWLVYQIVRPLLKFLTTPVNRLTLGIAWILINLIALYVFTYVVNSLNFGVHIGLGSITQTFILSIIISLLTMLGKAILD